MATLTEQEALVIKYRHEGTPFRKIELPSRLAGRPPLKYVGTNWRGELVLERHFGRYCTPERIRQIEAKACRKMQRQIRLAAEKEEHESA